MPKSKEQIIKETHEILEQPLKDFYSSSATGTWRDHINPIDQLSEAIARAIVNAASD